LALEGNVILETLDKVDIAIAHWQDQGLLKLLYKTMIESINFNRQIVRVGSRAGRFGF
jgi:hypothetical protein